jgi:hypothetical protein
MKVSIIHEYSKYSTYELEKEIVYTIFNLILKHITISKQDESKVPNSSKMQGESKVASSSKMQDESKVPSSSKVKRFAVSIDILFQIFDCLRLLLQSIRTYILRGVVS